MAAWTTASVADVLKAELKLAMRLAGRPALADIDRAAVRLAADAYLQGR